MKRFLLALLIVIIAIITVIYFNMGYIVKKAVNKYGSEVTGTEVSLEGFNFAITKGTASISKLSVANPSGYDAKNIFDLENISVSVNLKSLTTDTIVIESIVVNQPIITFEALSLQQNNIKTLQNNIASNLPQTQKTQSISSSQEKPAKKILIKKFVLSNATAQIVLPNIKQQSITLPEIVITDFDGNIQKQMAKILNTIINATMKSVTSITQNALKSVAQENLNKITDSIKDKINLKGIF